MTTGAGLRHRCLAKAAGNCYSPDLGPPHQDPTLPSEDVESSQGELYLRVRGQLLHRIEARVTHNLKTRFEAEDVLHEAFLRAPHSNDVFWPDSDRGFYAWVYSIAKHLIIDQARRHSVQNFRFARETGAGGPRLSGVVGRERNPESALERREWVEEVLSRLKESEAELIRLYKLEGKIFTGIVTASGKTTSAVQRAYSRALANFREALGR